MYEYLIAVPLLISQLVRFVLPVTLNNFHFQTPYKWNLLIYLSVYIILGIILWKAFELENESMQSFVIVLSFFTIVYYYWSDKSKKLSILLLFVLLFFAYCLYNSIFLSILVNNKRTFYLNLISAYIVWVCFMITMTETNYKYFFELNQSPHLDNAMV